MDADDNASETQSQTQTDLTWDHSGDVESDPLLGPESSRVSASDRPGNLQLSYEQAQELLQVLDNSRYVLETFVNQTRPQVQGVQNQRPTRSWWASHCFPRRRRSIAKYIFFITAALQALNLVVVSIIDIYPKNDDQSVVTGTGITMILLQMANLFFIVLVSVRLVRQLYKHKVSILLLAQSYMSTLLLFAGIYTLTYRMAPKSWKFIQEDLEENPVLVIVLYSKFLFFSVSTATLCGSDNVLPQEWYNCLFTSCQMLMSFVYFASILGQTLSQDTQYWLGLADTPTPVEGRSHRTVSGSLTRVSGIATHVRRNYGATNE
ncbi:hypothetical protein BaRGS_00021070, partial [Batillaria attramentaria]